MLNRYRVEIYDENKLNDLTIYSDTKVDKEYLTELVFSNIKNFQGTVRGFVYDKVTKKKTTALFLAETSVKLIQSYSAAATELGLARMR